MTQNNGQLVWDKSYILFIALMLLCDKNFIIVSSEWRAHNRFEPLILRTDGNIKQSFIVKLFLFNTYASSLVRTFLLLYVSQVLRLGRWDAVNF